MKQTIIRINDISDIDTSRISVYDLNNRYIDSQGNMYGLKYNKVNRKIEIIKIIRAHDKTAAALQQRLVKKRYEAAEMNGGAVRALNEDTAQADEPQEEFNPDAFIERTIELLRTHKDRLKGIMMNIRNSNIIPKDNKTESNQMEDIFRNIDIDCIQGIDSLLSYQKELVEYPRSLAYYQSKMDDRARQITETLAVSNRKVLRFIYLAEILESLRHLCRMISNLLRNLNEFLADKNPDDAMWMSTHERQSFKDGMMSISNTLAETDRLMDDLAKLEEYTYHVDNF